MSGLADHTTPTTRVALWRFLPTVLAILAAATSVWLIWETYVASPWTRDGTVRAYVLMVTPQLSGRVTEVAVRADQFARKGDLLMVIDPKDYDIEVQAPKLPLQSPRPILRTSRPRPPGGSS